MTEERAFEAELTILYQFLQEIFRVPKGRHRDDVQIRPTLIKLGRAMGVGAGQIGDLQFVIPMEFANNVLLWYEMEGKYCRDLQHWPRKNESLEELEERLNLR